MQQANTPSITVDYTFFRLKNKFPDTNDRLRYLPPIKSPGTNPPGSVPAFFTGTVPVLLSGTVPGFKGDSPRVDGCETTAFFSASDAKSNVDSTQKRGSTVSSAQYFPISAQTPPQKPLGLFKKSSLTLQHRDSIPQDYQPARLRANPPGTIPFANSRLIVAVP